MMEHESVLANLQQGCRVLVVGDLMLDEYLWGHVERISAEAPVPILSVVQRESTLGGAGNVVKNLRSLGVPVAAVGVVGDDAAGKQTVERLEALGADASGVVVDEKRISTRKTRLMSLEHRQQVFRLDEETAEPVCGEIEARLARMVREKAKTVQAVVCSDYLKGVLTEHVLKSAFAAADECGVPAVVAPKDTISSKYAGASILFPNIKELGQLVGTPPDGNKWLNGSARWLMERLDLEALVVTRGSHGMALFQPAGKDLRRIDIPTVAQSVYDVTGAGDTSLAVFTAAIASGTTVENAVHLANIAAGIVVGKRGTAVTTLDEIREHIGKQGLRLRHSDEFRPAAAITLEQ